MQSAKLQRKKKRHHNDNEETAEDFYKKRQKSVVSYEDEQNEKDDFSRDSIIQNSVAYYKTILLDLKKGNDSEILRDECIYNVLQESEGKEVELSCHTVSSHCLELLLSHCKDSSVIQRFMTAFADSKIRICGNASASHITELLMHHAIKAVQKGFAVLDSNENEEKTFAVYCMNWIAEFGNFALEYLDDCLSSEFSCHVLTTLIKALAGDFAENKEFMSKNLKVHKQEFQFQFSDINSPEIKEQTPVILKQIPKLFSDMLKELYKSIVKSENLIYYIHCGSSATVIEALIFALKERRPKSCKKMISKITKKLLLEKNEYNVPLSLLDKNASFVFDEMFKVADEDLQLELWNQYISDHIAVLVVHSVGNFIIQRLYDAVKSKTVLEIVCKRTWSLFDVIFHAKHFGIFVSIATACFRLGAQQSFFMKNIMRCLHCFEHQDLVVPLLLGFQKYENYSTAKNDTESNLKVCLQGSLVVQAILKYQKPIKAVKSICDMSPNDIEYLAGHTQGCHVLNAFFGSITVGDKNKEILLVHLEPVLVNMACDRNKSLTLSRIWTCLSLKLKEHIAKYLATHESSLRTCKSGYGIYKKFGIAHLSKLQDWKEMQSNISSIKNKSINLF